MRISTGQQYISLQQRLQEAQMRVAELQERLSSGKRLHRPSDDPAAALGVLLLRSAKAAADRHKAIADVAKQDVKLAEAAIGEMDGLMKRAKQLALAGANASTDQAGREAMAQEVRGLQAQLLRLANSQNAYGRYIFAGFEETTKPFERNAQPGPPYLIYNGDDNVRKVEVGPDYFVAANLVTDKQFIAAYDALEDAALRLSSGDASGLSGVTLELLDKASQRLRLLRGDAGSLAQQFEAAAETAVRRSDHLTSQISDREDADLAETIAELQKAEMTLQAALAALASASRLSLLDFIR